MSADRPVAIESFEARRRPPFGGLNATFLLIEIRRLTRNRRTVVVTLVVPVVLFLLFRARRDVAIGGIEITAATTMIGIAVYGAMLAATSGGAMVSIERALGWSRQLRLTPLQPFAYVAIKVMVAMLLGLTSVIVVYAFGIINGVDMSPSAWVLSGLLAWATSFVFAAFGLFMGYLLPSENVMQVISPVLGVFSLFGGLFVPLSLLPSVMQDVAPYMPTYGVASIAEIPARGWSVRPDLVAERRRVDRRLRRRGDRALPSRHAPHLTEKGSDTPRLRSWAVLVGGVSAAVMIGRHARRPTGLDTPGGIVMGDAAGYDSLSKVLLGPFYRSVAADVAAVASTGAQVLDIGCGPGHLVNRLARDHRLEVTGLDLDPTMIDRARANARQAVAAERQPTFVAGGVAALPFADRSFDLVVSTLSMHHWADVAAGEAEIARVLRPGGRALMWDIRPGVVPLHRHQPDPLEALGGSLLEVASVTPWRWPWRLAWTQRIELVPGAREGDLARL